MLRESHRHIEVRFRVGLTFSILGYIVSGEACTLGIGHWEVRSRDEGSVI